MTAAPAAPHPEYFRRDQSGGITAPDLSKECSAAAHIVRARGKRTKYTSVSLDRNKIDDFGPALYEALCPEVIRDGHTVIEHSALLDMLREASASSEKDERVKALQAQRYARRRKEGLIDWTFDISQVEKKDRITWAFTHVQKFFREL
jgi:hypothetical protein